MRSFCACLLVFRTGLPRAHAQRAWFLLGKLPIGVYLLVLIQLD